MSTLAVPKYFHQFLVNFEMNNLARSIYVKEQVKWPRQGFGRRGPAPAGLGQGMLNFKVWLGQVRFWLGVN